MEAGGSNSGQIVQGQIKWFDPVRGFGFLSDAAGGLDVLLHANVLRSFGQSSVADGARVVVMAVATPRGRQAVEVVAIEPPPSDGNAPIADLDSVDMSTLESLPLLPARVKWFDKSKGFGFANIFGRRGDVFLHVEVLRHWGFADLVPGEAVALRIIDGPRGMMAAQIIAWDRAASDTGAATQNGAADPSSESGTGGPAGPAGSGPAGASAATTDAETGGDDARRDLSRVLDRMRVLSRPDAERSAGTERSKVAG